MWERKRTPLTQFARMSDWVDYFLCTELGNQGMHSVIHGFCFFKNIHDFGEETN